MQLRMGDRGAVDLGFEQGQLHGHGPWGGGRRRILQDGGASTGPKATGRRNVIPGGPASTASFLPLPCLCIAAEAAPAGVCGQSQGELEIVDQAGAAQPRGDEGDAPTRAVFRLVQVTISHDRSEEQPSELQSLMRISYAVFCLKKKKKNNI